MGNRLMHYQAKPVTFDPNRQYEQIVKGRGQYTKPQGFWVSVEGQYDWPTWCRDEEVLTESLTTAHEVCLTDAANVLLITSADEIDQFHGEFAAASEFDRKYGYGPECWGIDWTSVAERYDGILITPYLWSRRFNGNCGWYYGWDCASGCIWNLSAIESVTVLSEVAQ